MTALDIDDVPEYEVLERIIHNAILRKDSSEAARQLLEKFGSLAMVIDAPEHELQKIPGIGPAASSFIKLIPFIYKKYRMSKWNGQKSFKNFDDIVRFMRDTLTGYTTEAFSVLCLDVNYRHLSHRVLFEGKTSLIEVDTRKLVDYVLASDAVNLVVAHNHPSNIAVATSDDIRTTKHIFNTLKPLGITLIDHIIYTEDKFISLASENLIPSVISEIKKEK